MNKQKYVMEKVDTSVGRFRAYFHIKNFDSYRDLQDPLRGYIELCPDFTSCLSGMELAHKLEGGILKDLHPFYTPEFDEVLLKPMRDFVSNPDSKTTMNDLLHACLETVPEEYFIKK